MLKKQDIEKDHRNLVDKSLDTKSHLKDNLLSYILQVGLFKSELSSSLKEVRFIMKNLLLVYLYLTSNIITLNFKTITLFIFFMISSTID